MYHRSSLITKIKKKKLRKIKNHIHPQLNKRLHVQLTICSSANQPLLAVVYRQNIAQEQTGNALNSPNKFDHVQHGVRLHTHNNPVSALIYICLHTYVYISHK